MIMSCLSDLDSYKRFMEGLDSYDGSTWMKLGCTRNSGNKIMSNKWRMVTVIVIFSEGALCMKKEDFSVLLCFVMYRFCRKGKWSIKDDRLPIQFPK